MKKIKFMLLMIVAFSLFVGCAQKDVVVDSNDISNSEKEEEGFFDLLTSDEAPEFSEEGFETYYLFVKYSQSGNIVYSVKGNSYSDLGGKIKISRNGKEEFDFILMSGDYSAFYIDSYNDELSFSTELGKLKEY